MTTSVVVRTQFEAFHRWVDAPEEVSFLKNYHRHMFHVELEIEVDHDDRHIEFILLKRWLDDELKFLMKVSDLSCEQMAKYILVRANVKYGCIRPMTCSVFEDGENGARVRT